MKSIRRTCLFFLLTGSAVFADGPVLTGITCGNGNFVAAGAGGTILTSPDAANWTSQTLGSGSSSTSPSPVWHSHRIVIRSQNSFDIGRGG